MASKGFATTLAKGFCLLIATYASASIAVAAQTTSPPADIADVPDNARVWTVQNLRGKSGEESLWLDASGSYHSRFTAAGGETLDCFIAVNRQGLPVRLEISGSSQEKFRIVAGTAEWQAGSITHRSSAPRAAFYVSNSTPVPFAQGSVTPLVVLLRALLADADHKLATLPSGEARLERLTSATVSQGTDSRKLTAWRLSGLGLSPYILWVDENNDFFAYVEPNTPMERHTWVPKGWEASLSTLLSEQTKAITGLSRQRAAVLMAPAGKVLFRDVTVYDAGTNGFLEHMSVLVEGNSISQAGAAKSFKTPSATRVIDGRGKTLLPGLWDMHAHFWLENSGLSALSNGVTSVREMSNFEHVVFDQKARIEAGTLLGPQIYPNQALKGGEADPFDRALYVTSQEEALAAVRTAKSKGYHGIKILDGLSEQWLAAMVTTAHQLGVKISGHVPAGVPVMAAIESGYDAISHIPHFSRAGIPQEIASLPPSDPSRGPKAVRAMKFMDVADGPVGELVDALVRKNVAVDPTLAFYEQSLVPAPAEPLPAYLPYAERLPALDMHAYLIGGSALPDGAEITRQEYSDGYQGLLKLTKHMHERGVTLLAGTDQFDERILIRELELFVKAGMSIGAAIETATDGAARYMGVDNKVGSIAPGMRADLILVNADVSNDIGNLRQLEWVMSGGRLMNAAELRKLHQ